MAHGIPEILVVGDIMLDVYTDVHIKSAGMETNALIVRESPEGPRSVLGGAANVASNLTGLGRRVRLFGMVGQDSFGGEVKADLTRFEVDASCVWQVGGYRTPVRHRIVSSHGPLLRVDRDGYLDLHRVILPDSDPLQHFGHLFADTLTDCAANAVKPVVVISDYGQGYCDPSVLWSSLQEAVRFDCPLLVDPPRDGSWHNYASALTTFKPNIRQAANFLKSLYRGTDYRLKYKDLGIPETGFAQGSCDPKYALECCTRLFEAVRTELRQQDMPFRYLWLTLGSYGSLISTPSHTPPMHLPGRVVEVADVTGAGDTAMAVLASHLAATKNYDWATFVEGVIQANFGAAVAVSQRGTYRLTSQALQSAIKAFGGDHGKTQVSQTD